MLTYSYTAYKKETDEILKAEVQAENERAAAKLLVSQGMFPISIDIKGQNELMSKLGLSARVSGKDRVIFTRQLSTLINAGLPLTQSLRTVTDQIQNKALHEVVEQIVANVEGGTSLSQSFAMHPKIFSEIYISLVAAGEASGSLDKALERIANQQEKDAQILSKIRGALIYPVIVLVVILLVLIFMLTSVLPQVSGLYANLGQKLPITTQILLITSQLVVKFWFLAIIAVIGLALAIRNYIASEQGRRLWDGFKFSMPVFGHIFRKVYMARFSRTLGTMLESGIPMLEALRTVRGSIGNVLVAETLDKAMSGVKGGRRFHQRLKTSLHLCRWCLK